ncbi:MAG: DMT family transporter [Atribacterota bacterium]|nr:DMT family transporter [Atribacterota bacterium]
METNTVILVIISAFIHSLWNLMSKKSRNKLVFNWLMISIGTILYLPPFLYYIFTNKVQIQPAGWQLIALSSLFRVFYFYFLGKSYSYGDLSITYSIARSLPLFVLFLAYIFLNEKLSLIDILGIAVILTGIYLLSFSSFNLKLSKNVKKAIMYAFFTATFSAFYSINDKLGLLYVYPFCFIYLSIALTSFLYLPIIIRKNKFREMKIEWKINSKPILISGYLFVFSYLLILFAFAIDKVSYIVSLRQLSIVFGVMFGIFLLKEEHGKRRIIASSIMFIGFFLVVLS